MARSAEEALIGELEEAAVPPRWRRWSTGARRLARQQPLGAVSAVLLVLIVFTAIFAPALAPYDPNKPNFGHSLEGPSRTFLAGTDEASRDVLSRTIYGARISLIVGLAAVGIGISIGSTLGLISGYFGGLTDLIIQRFVDMKMAFPQLILALTLVSVLGPSVRNVIIAISVGLISYAARIVRGATLSAKNNVYVEAARCLGASNFRIVTRHILPNILAPIIVIASVTIGGAILAEASLSFLGLGIKPPTPSWGGMLSGEARRHLERAPWLAIWPGLAISLVVLSVNLFGDSLRDILDPRMRGAR